MTSKFTILFYLVLIIFTVNESCAQNAPFDVQIKKSSFKSSLSLQSYTSAVWKQYWVFMSGRTDGLHRRQPFVSFSPEERNTMIYVFDTEKDQVYKCSSESLPISIKEQLSASNAVFEQVNEELFIVGGYGYSDTNNSHITFPSLIVVNIPTLIEAVMHKKEMNTSFFQIEDTRMQVTGGYLEYAEGKFFLVCGQKFMGRYNPMGPEFGPGYQQEYTEEVRTFSLEKNSENNTWSISDYVAKKDSDWLHRRDYNLCPQQNNNGDIYFRVFSGVFLKDEDLPFHSIVDIKKDGAFAPKKDAYQYLNQYHTAFLPIFNSKTTEMHTLFFGGISRCFFDSTGKFQVDDNVPFVKSISLCTENTEGKLFESQIGSMPGFLGTSAEFIPNPNAPFSQYEILDWNLIESDSILAGYIIGGIKSLEANILFSSEGEKSAPMTEILEVWLYKRVPSNVLQIKGKDIFNASLKVRGNSGVLKYRSLHEQTIRAIICTEDGKEVHQIFQAKVSSGNYEKKFSLKSLPKNQKYFLVLSNGTYIDRIEW